MWHFVIIPGKLNVIGYVLVTIIRRNGSLIRLVTNLWFSQFGDVQGDHKWSKELKMYGFDVQVTVHHHKFL